MQILQNLTETVTEHHQYECISAIKIYFVF